MADLYADLAGAVGSAQVRHGVSAGADYGHDEALDVPGCAPTCVVTPGEAAEVAAVLRIAAEHRTPVTARGAATGLCGGCVPEANGVVVVFERMNGILEVDAANHFAVVQPGVTLGELDDRVAAEGLMYPVYPGEMSASVGGTVSTNAGGMRAIAYGVTRQHVLGLQAVLAGGQIIRTGGRVTKSSSGYDLTQLLVGSEGTLGLITEATLKLTRRPRHRRTVLAPFADLEGVVGAVPGLVSHGPGIAVMEYIDGLALAAAMHTAQMDMGVPQRIRDKATAYLVVVLEGSSAGRLDEDLAQLCELMLSYGAMDPYILDAGAARALIDIREKGFWTAKAAGANEVVDMVVPRAAMAEFFARARKLGEQTQSGVVGCGHAGDGNVHLAIFQDDNVARARLVRELCALSMDLGGAISGEHGIGRNKTKIFAELEDPARFAVMRTIKQALDPAGILNPGVMFASSC